MEVITAFKDIVDHLLIIKGIEWVRIEGASKSCTLKTMDKKAGFVIDITMNEPIEKMNGTFGIHDIAHLNRILRAPGFDIPTASVQFIGSESGKEKWGGGFLHFDNGAGQTYDKSIVGKYQADGQMNVPGLRQPFQFDTAFFPDEKGIELLKYWHKEMQEFDVKNVAFLNKNGNVICRYGLSCGRQNYEFPFKRSAGATSQVIWEFPTEPILAILNLYPTSKSVSISISDIGLMKIDVDSGLANYCYLIVPHQQVGAMQECKEYRPRSYAEIIAHLIEGRKRVQENALKAKNAANDNTPPAKR
ncbi:hypothetical protein D0T25_20630 [Duganella sp. BJB488]|uniref:hypothetical protein n=1 Tax=unclassified Duganella TaxID=2636909 RepID=UPI000E3539B0|nr:MULTISPECIES: hypothetical protein [unclassified Duganella]RFP17896.1 hypothetical protein D0T26_17005 [Duganella sp. BJB489]RFP17984.1 hypothetical protein D0T25_20630 [Duganella sp. BJB488]RFP37739.1 hypothetical protein D0T24_07105 [Duganella sp. BJB480]